MKFDSTAFSAERRDFVHYFLNLLHWKWICWQADKRNGFIRLKHDYLTKIIPKADWQAIRTNLVELGVIDWDESYCPNYRSYGFLLAPDYRKTRRTVCTNTRLNRKIEKVYTEDSVKPLPIHNWLREKFDLLDFDMDLAHAIIPTMRPDQHRDAATMSVEQYHLLLTDLCRKFVEMDFFLTCDKYGRVHTPITSLPKELRCCLLIRDRNLVGLDLANSQPLIAGVCARQFFNSPTSKTRLLKKKVVKDKNPYCYREMQAMAKRADEIIGKKNSIIPMSINESPTTFSTTHRITTERKSQVPASESTYNLAQVKHSAVKQEERTDLQEYIELCETGQFYESLMQPGEDRRVFKEKFYQEVFFGKNQYTSKLKDRFEDRCPSMAQMLKAVKKNNYRHSSWLMQNYEATIFIYTICNRIREEMPDCSVFTIHDSILTVPESVEDVEMIIMDEFSKLGLRPTLTKENYAEVNQHANIAVA